MINQKRIEETARQIFENSFEISILQTELEGMLNSIYQNNKEFERGRLSKNKFNANEKSLKRKSVSIIKSIKTLLKTNVDMLVNIKSEVEKQECSAVKKEKKAKGKK
ncbi:MAG: hypothetical protein JW700_01110 [Candidatus Aenigmarchaeota archaeon]|nr:hypothetical protein [Candidatus Aenigmarchaeota archaeon]